jgi:KaiC/GvpD/RAD55 family RecA-like ATPase
MTERPGPASIRKLATGVPGLDDVLGGGLPELSFNLIVGGPGCGKTTLAHQMMFANATPDCPGLYFTIVGEPISWTSRGSWVAARPWSGAPSTSCR